MTCLRRRGPRTRVLVLAILCLGGLAVFTQSRQLDQARRRLDETRAQLGGLEAALIQAEAERASAQEAARREQANRIRVLAAVARTEREVSRVAPDSLWSEPPAEAREWNESSPYVWLPKDRLGLLPIEPFQEDGGLRDEVAEVLTIGSANLLALNERLRDVLRHYRELELAHASYTEEHLAGTRESGTAVTVEVRPIPEEAQPFRQALEAALSEGMGAQRAALLQEVGRSWLEKQFSAFGAEPKTISVLRRPNGSYSISRKAGGNWLSVGVPGERPEDLRYYVPEHLLPLFTNVPGPGPR